jgi:hypothetical protein
MVKRTATIVILLLTLALTAIAEPKHHKKRQNDVPEPGSLLVFGSGLLLSFRSLKRKKL